MKPNILSCNNATRAGQLIDEYFTYIEGEYHIEQKPVKVTKDHVETIDQKVWDRPPEPATISGLAFHLGFNSRDEMEAYRRNGPFAKALNRAVLRIEMSYEAALHQNATGAMFVLKSIGWNEKPPQPENDNESNNTLKVEIINTGPPPAGNEKDVPL